MRILITGVAGFVGGYLASLLAKDPNINLYGIDRSTQRLLPSLQPRLQCFIGDLTDEAFVLDVLKKVKPTAIYHLAGQAFVPTAWANPWGTFELNVLPQLNLLKGLIDLNLNTRFLSITSSKVYGQVSSDQMPINEKMPIQPNNPYGLSKAAQDLMAQQYYLSHKLPIIIVRPFNHIGPRQSPNFVTSAFARQIAQAEAGTGPTVIKVGNLTPKRDFTDVQDVVKAYTLLMAKGQPGQAYNIASGQAVSIQHILDTFIKLSSVKITVEQDPTKMRPTDQPISYGAIDKIKKELGWQPTIALKESLTQILNYWRNELTMDNG